MRNYVKDFIEWMAQRIIVRATARAVEIVEEHFDRSHEPPKALPAPRLPEIELH